VLVIVFYCDIGDNNFSNCYIYEAEFYCCGSYYYESYFLGDGLLFYTVLGGLLLFE